MKKIISFCSLLLVLFSCDSREKQYLTDSTLKILQETLSHDKNHKIIKYCFDQGATGDSRIYWAIIPTPFDSKQPLNDFIIPDGYQASGWTKNDEIILEKWTPDYDTNLAIEFKNGDQFNNLKVFLQTNVVKQKVVHSFKNINPTIQNDTITIEHKSALLYEATEESIKKEILKVGEADFYVGADDSLFYLNESETFLKKQHLNIITTDNNTVLRFIMNDKSDYLVKLDTVKEIWGIYLFEPKQKRKRIHMTATAAEYKEYYK